MIPIKAIGKERDWRDSETISRSVDVKAAAIWSAKM